MLVNARAGSSAVFLDRDGTINEEVEYLARPEQLILLPTVADAVRLLNEKGIRVIVVTNQSGIARGYFSEDQLQQIHTILQQKLAQEGAHIDRFYYCPHHPDYGEEPYRQNCECRKPHTGMFLQAARDEKLDLSSCYLVGDKVSDLEAARAAGVKAVLVLTGFGIQTRTLLERGTIGDISAPVMPDLLTAVQWIVRDCESHEDPHC